MNHSDIAALMKGVAPAVRHIIEATVLPLVGRIDELESQLAEARAVDHPGLIRAAVAEAIASLPPAPAGQDGAPGRDGIDGQTGKDGLNGRDGVPGKDGADGVPGRDGIDGQNGKDGLGGKDGSPGADGQDGAPGRDGIDGNHGKDGLAGIDGAPGRDGTDGLPGADGKDGLPGVDGSSGRDGIDGVAGRDGADGTAGRDGVDGERGLEGPPGKLPIVREFAAGVNYQGGVVSRDGSTYQALRDTANEPPHADWICIASAGRNGSDGRSLRIRGTHSAGEDYQALDIVALNGASFAAKHDDPGECPGEGWQLVAAQGKRGQPGERGLPGRGGDKGDAGQPVVAAHVDPMGLLTLTSGDGSVVECDLYPLLSQLSARG